MPGGWRGAGVATTLHIVPGAYHNFDAIEAKAPVSQDFLEARITALDEALNGSGPVLPSGAEVYGARGRS